MRFDIVTSHDCGCFEGFSKGHSERGKKNAEAVGGTKFQPQAWASPVPHCSRGTTTTGGAGNGLEALAQGQCVRLDVDSELRRADVLTRLRPKVRSKFEVEQLVAAPGSLPKPMDACERERLLTKGSAELLARLPPELLESQGPEGQELRRSLVHGLTVVFFAAGYPGKRFVFERASQLGIKSIIIDHPDSWSRGLVDEGIVAKFVPIDMSRSSSEIFEEAAQCIGALDSDATVGHPDGICTFVELSVPLVARLAERFGLPGPPPAAVDAARSKHATRVALKDAGLPTPRNCLIHSEEDLVRAAEHVGFPAVLKPISGAASLGVKKVTAHDELVGCYREVAAELSSLVVVSGALAQGNGANVGINAKKVVDLTLLLEQYLDGDEVDIDIVVSEGQWRYAGITDNGPTVEPYFNETWGVCPSLLALHKQRELKDFAIRCLVALGFESGVFHVECRYTSTGPQLIEVNARMGGGPVHEHNLRTWGVDLVEETLFLALGIPARPPVPPAPYEAIAYYMVPAKSSGTLERLPDLDILRRAPGVIWARPLVKVGDRIVGPADGLPTWVVDVFVSRATAKEALDFVLKWEAENPPRIRP